MINWWETEHPKPCPGEDVAPECQRCKGTGIRDVWVVDGWSVIDCLCTYGWTMDQDGKWCDSVGRPFPSAQK